MEHNVHSTFSGPSKIGIFLFVSFWITTYFGTVKHSDVNLWIATIVGLITLGKYCYEFYLFIKKRKNRKHE